MNKFLRFRWELGLCLIGGVLSGCQSASSGTIAVTGKVTKGGQPLEGAAVTFVPPVAAEGKAASGTTDASGAYKLTTFVNGDGALPGSYKVRITKFAGAAASSASVGSEAKPEDVDAAYKAMEKKGQNVVSPQTLAPASTANEIAPRFANEETSGLTAEVKAGASNAFDFEVTDQ